MPFKFLFYLQPTNYFRLKRNCGDTIFPKFDNLPNFIKSQINLDISYKSKQAREYDLSWQVIRKGYIGNAKCYTHFENVSIYDNYVFARKYFHKIWVFFTLFLRLITLKNPFIEIQAYYSTRKILRAVDFRPILDTFQPDFNSKLLLSNPKVSVIIPTLNRYDYLKNVLSDFEKQDYYNFEVVVVDQSDDFDNSFYDRFKLDFKIIKQEEKALWLARNNAISKSSGILIALSEDDVRISSDWLTEHIKCLDRFNAEVSAGVFYPQGRQIPKDRLFFSIASQFATGNAMLYRSVFEKIGLFDRQFEKQRMGDGEFGNRLYNAGFKSISNPLASCVDVKAVVGGLREMGSWDAFRPTKWFAPRPIPSVVYYFRRYFGRRATVLALLKSVPPSILSYKYKSDKLMLFLGTLLSILLLPIILFQVTVSWCLASKKIKEGPLISNLD
ncbi:MAG: glycosyltransferase family A protein [Bacteroidota bacterium]